MKKSRYCSYKIKDDVLSMHIFYDLLVPFSV